MANGLYFPDLRREISPETCIALIAMNSIDAITDEFAFMGRVIWPGGLGTTKNIVGIKTLMGSVTAGSGSTLKVSIEGIDTSSTARPNGVEAGYMTTTTMPTANVVNTFSGISPSVAKAHGDTCAIVFSFSVFGSTTSIQFKSPWGDSNSGADNQHDLFKCTAFTANNWATASSYYPSRYPLMVLVADDGTFGTLEGYIVADKFVKDSNFNSGSTNNMYGAKINLKNALEVSEIAFISELSGANSEFVYEIYDASSNLIATTDTIKRNYAWSYYPAPALWHLQSKITLEANIDYYVFLRSKNTANMAIFYEEVASGEESRWGCVTGELFNEISYVTASYGTPITINTPVTTRRPRMSLIGTPVPQSTHFVAANLTANLQ